MKTAHAAIILCVLMVLMLAVTWQMWLNPTVDSGREMNTPLRLLNGELLYSQVFYMHGPIAPYVNAGLYALFGRNLNTLYWAGIAGSLLLVLSIFHLGCRFMPSFQSMLSAVAVLLLCVFKESGNTIFPYSYAVLYGTLSGTLALVALVRYFYTDKYGALLAAGILSGLAFCCKMEFGIAVIAALLTVVSITPRGRRLRVCRFLLPGFLVFPVLVGILLFTRIPLESFFMDTFVYPGFLPDEIAYFYKAKLGFNDPGRTFRELISALAVLLGCAGLFSLASIRLARNSRETGYIQSERHSYRLWGLTLGCIILIPVHFLIFGSHWDMNPLRALPLLFIGMIIYCAKSLYDRPERGPFDRALLVVSVYSLAVLARIITRVPAGGGYGVGLLPVPLMLFFYMAVTDLSVFRVPVPAKKFRRRAVSVFLAIALAATMGVIVFRYRKDTHITVHTPRGNFTVQAAIGSAMSRTLEYISRNSNPGEYILSLPEGSSLNFLADRPAPLRHEILTPGFLDRPAELDAIQILKEKNVRLIFMFNRPTSEFGAKVFGRNYYRTLMEWIESNYRVDAVFGDGATSDTQIGDGPFFIKCYRKKQFS
jgi:4-amino-4-deoxy-L-arabinose transferase-like glycosyltransferase